MPSPLAASDPGMMIRRRVNGIPGPSIYTSDRVIGYTGYVDTFVMLYLMRDVVHFIRQYMTSMTLNVFCVPPHERAWTLPWANVLTAQTEDWDVTFTYPCHRASRPNEMLCYLWLIQVTPEPILDIRVVNSIVSA